MIPNNDNFMKILDTLGKVIADKDFDIFCKQSLIDSLTKEKKALQAKVEELEKIAFPANNNPAEYDPLRKEG